MLKSVLDEQPLPRRKPAPSERELRAMLEGRDKELAAKLRDQGKIVSKILLVIFLLVVASGAYIYISAEKELAAAPPEPPAGASPPAVPNLASLAVPGAAQGVEWPDDPAHPSPKAPAPAPKSDGKLVDKGDIRFAMELFNYVQPGKAQPQATQPPPSSAAKSEK